METLIFLQSNLFDWLERGDASRGRLRKIYEALIQNAGGIYKLICIIGYSCFVLFLLWRCMTTLLDHTGRRSFEGLKGFLLRWIIVVIIFSSVIGIAGLLLSIGGRI